jgi:hypothetical protein
LDYPKKLKLTAATLKLKIFAAYRKLLPFKIKVFCPAESSPIHVKLLTTFLLISFDAKIWGNSFSPQIKNIFYEI